MEKTITAAEANRQFSALLRGVREGATYVVTSHGRPVARIVPVRGDADERDRREKAKRELLRHLRAQTALNLPRITRDEMHQSQGSRRLPAGKVGVKRPRDSAGRPAPGHRRGAAPAKRSAGLEQWGPQAGASISGTRAPGALGPAPVNR